MINVKLPSIPKGNLRKVHVLSEPAANELFRECSEIASKYWPFPKEHLVERKGRVATFRSGSCLSLPFRYKGNDISKYIEEGSFLVFGQYQGSDKNPKNPNNRFAGGSAKLLEFLCESETNMNDPNFIDSTRIAQGAHVFIYSQHRPKELRLTHDHSRYSPTSEDCRIIEDLLKQTEQPLKDITDGIEDCLQKRGAVLTRGWLSNQFVI